MQTNQLNSAKQQNKAQQLNNVQQLLTQHLGIWTSAETEKKSGRGRASGNLGSVYGIKKLRELILELAVRGKLVPQDANDEPASELLKRIQAEKAKLIAEGKLKKEKLLGLISEDEKPFELPIGWEWAKLSEVLEVINGRAYKKNEMLDTGTPLLRVGNLFTSNEWYYSDLELEENKYIESGDLIYAWSASFGPFIWSGERVIYHYHIWKLNIIDDSVLFKGFIYNYLLSITEKIKSQGNGIAMLHMTKERMELLDIIIPPLAEQKRIVTKVNALMLLCDQLENQHLNAAEAHETLVSELLATLTQSQDVADFNANWQRIYAHFDVLFTTQASIAALKQTLLQLAVMGKLVPQDPSDEPASELLKRIQAEKAKLIVEGKLKKEKPLAPIAEDEPFGLPKGWEWTTLSTLTIINPRDAANDDLKASFVPMTLIGTQFNEQHEHEVRTWKEIKQGFTHFAEGDIGVAKITPCFENSKACVFKNLENGIGAGTTELHVVRPLGDTLNQRYVLAYFKSPKFLEVGESKMTGTAGQKRLPKDFVEFNPFPLPPLAEQHRIVAKVDELMVLCDQLKTRIQQASQQQQWIADALVSKAVAI